MFSAFLIGCFKFNGTLGGTFLSDAAGVTSHLQCQALCFKNTKCQFFQFNNFPGGTYCNLFATKTAEGCQQNCITGPKICP